VVNLTVIVLTKNEEKNIKRCLEGLTFADEIIVLDDESVDRTEEIAVELGVKVLRRKLSSDFSAQRNYGIEKAAGKWIMFVDADEVVTKELSNEIVQLINDPMLHYTSYSVKRQDILWGRVMKYSEFGNSRQIRLAKKGAGLWKRRVHEVWETEGITYKLKNPLYHYPHENLKAFINGVNYMSTLHAEANYLEGKKSGLFKITIYPPAKFIIGFIFNFGFLDKTAGFVAAMVMSFHSFLAWSKLWNIQKQSKH
jgi:glycosyltransferase involved in cell wall biosynthesis